MSPIYHDLWSLPVVVPQLRVTGDQVYPLAHATTLSLKCKHMNILQTKENKGWEEARIR